MTRAWHQQVKRSPASERTDESGSVFDSKAELKRWNELKLLERVGVITGLIRQQQFNLAVNGRQIKIRSRGFPNGQPCRYTVDFSYWDVAAERRIFEEYKGRDSEASRLRRAVTEAIYQIEITVTGPAAKATPRRIATDRREEALSE